MVRIMCAMTAALLLSIQCHAATVLQKGYSYSYEFARDTTDNRQFVICANRSRTTLVPELSPPPIAVRFTSDSEKPSAPPEEPRAAETAPARPVSETTLVKTIHFALDSSEVRDRSALALLARSLKSDPALIGVRVKGFTCDLGSKSYNDRLALRRAEAVVEVLGEEGFRVVEIGGEGKCCYAPGEKRNSRRAEITVLHRPGKDKSDER